MITRSFKNIVLVFFDDDAENQQRDQFLNTIFEANILHLSDEERETARTRYKHNRDAIISQYRIQKSIYYIRIDPKFTYEHIVGLFRSFIDSGSNLILCDVSKMTYSYNVFNHLSLK